MQDSGYDFLHLKGINPFKLMHGQGVFRPFQFYCWSRTHLTLMHLRFQKDGV